MSLKHEMSYILKFLKDECDNFIKLFTKIDSKLYKICSTNSLNPKCRILKVNLMQKKIKSSFHKKY
jgi:hypothetical protein